VNVDLVLSSDCGVVFKSHCYFHYILAYFSIESIGLSQVYLHLVGEQNVFNGQLIRSRCGFLLEKL